MEQAATPGGLGLPCSPKQALALYQHLFQCPASLRQLQAALRQVQEGQACPLGLELPTVLLEMERNRRAQEQLLWDLELLTGAGLALFWPPRVQFCGLRDQAQYAWSQCTDPCGRTDGDSEQPMNRSPSRRASEAAFALLQGASCRPIISPRSGCLPELDPTTSSSSAEPENSEFNVERLKGAGQEPSQTGDSTGGVCLGGGCWGENLVQKEERGQAEPTTQRPLPPSSGSLWGRRITQNALEPSGLPSQGLPEPQDLYTALGWSLAQDRAELLKLLGIEIPQRQREEDPQEQKKETPQGQGGEAPQGENKEVPQSQREKTNQVQSGEATQALGQEVPGGLGREIPQGENKVALGDRKENHSACLRKETPQGQDVKVLQTFGGGGCISQAWEVTQEVPTPTPEGNSQGIPEDFCRSLGEQMPQPGGRESPALREMSTQLTPDKTYSQRQELALAVGGQGAGQDWAQLPGPGTMMLAALHTGSSEHEERPTARPGHTGLVHNWSGLQDPGRGSCPAEQQVDEARGPQAGTSMRFPGALEEPRDTVEVPKASKAAWPVSSCRAKASAAVTSVQQETALQRLLELHAAARRRRRQDREQQRLRVLDRLRMARNRHCRVHPLGPPPSPAQLPPKEDEGEQRRALREQLEQVHRERTRQLRALGARNTQNFQQLLRAPDNEKLASGEQCSSFPGPSNHC